MTGMYAELMGRAGGLMGGKGGSMHLTCVEHGAMGSYAIVGAHLPIAAGAAWSAQLRGSGQVAVCFFGDGTTNIGAFHEALNAAAVWKLPVVFVCENNQYMEYTASARSRPSPTRRGSGSAYGLEPILIDGNDVDVVYATAVRRSSARARARGRAYRGRDVSPRRPLPGRPGDLPAPEEVAAWMARDPVIRSREPPAGGGCGRARSPPSRLASRPRSRRPSTRRGRCPSPRTRPWRRTCGTTVGRMADLIEAPTETDLASSSPGGLRRRGDGSSGPWAGRRRGTSAGRSPRSMS